MTENQIARIIVDAAYTVHTTLGPGLLESVYESALAYELTNRNLSLLRQSVLPVVYQGITLDEAFRADLIVADKVIVEIKSVDKLTPLHAKQLLTYLRLANLKLGLLINFNAFFIKDGIQRLVNGLDDQQ